MSLDLNKYMQELETLVNMDSGSRFPAGTKRVADFFVEKFEKIGWLVEVVHTSDAVGPCLKICNRQADTYDLLFIGHMDTVFPEGTVAQRPFKVEGDRAYGPGVIDMKSGLLYAYYVAEELTEANALQDKNICIIFNPDEEISSVHSRKLIEQTAVNCRHAIVLEPARANGGTVKIRKGISKYFIDFHGKAAHAGVDPENGASAVDELCKWVLDLNQFRSEETGTSVNAGVISGGTAPNVVADHAQVQIDVRMRVIEEAEKFDARVRELAAKPFDPRVKIDVKGGLTRPPLNNPEGNAKLFVLLEDAAQELGIKIEWVATGGGSDGNFTSALGVPTLDTLGPIGGLGHGVGEYMEISSVVPRFKLLMGVVNRILK